MKKLIVALALLSIGALASAQEVGKVISSVQVIQQVAVPRQVCSQEQAPVQPNKSGAGAAMGAIALGALLLKELSGESAIERERAAQACECAKDPTKARRNVFLSATERQFRSPNRCC